MMTRFLTARVWERRKSLNRHAVKRSRQRIGSGTAPSLRQRNDSDPRCQVRREERAVFRDFNLYRGGQTVSVDSPSPPEPDRLENVVGGTAELDAKHVRTEDYH